MGITYYAGPTATPRDWFHVTMVYNGPTADEQITVYHDGTRRPVNTSRKAQQLSSTFRTLVIGHSRVDTSLSNLYSSVMLDELAIWNRKLTEFEVELIYGMY